jgi:hypothetical protein
MYNVKFISIVLLMEDVGVALMEPWNLGVQMENIRQLQEKINN